MPLSKKNSIAESTTSSLDLLSSKAATSSTAHKATQDSDSSLGILKQTDPSRSSSALPAEASFAEYLAQREKKVVPVQEDEFHSFALENLKQLGKQYPMMHMPLEAVYSIVDCCYAHDACRYH